MAVAVPLDIVYVAKLHSAVEHAEYEVLHLGIAQVEQELVAGRVGLASLLHNHPLGVLLIETGLGIDHLGLYPDAELETLGMGVVGKISYAFGNLLHVELPVAETGLVGITGVLPVGEPAVVEHEHFQAHRGGIVYHIRQGLGVEGEISAFPAVEQRRAMHRGIVHIVAAGPVVEVAACLSGSAAAVGPHHIRRRKGRAAGEGVFSPRGMDSGKNVETSGLIHLEIDFVVAAPAQGACKHFPVVLIEGIGIQAQQERGVGALRRAHSVAALKRLDAVRQALGLDVVLVGPGAVEMRQGVFFRQDGNAGGIEITEQDGFLAAVDDFRMRHNHVLLLVGVKYQRHLEGLLGIAQQDAGPHQVRGYVLHAVALIEQLGIQAAVRIRHGKGRLEHEAAAGRRIHLDVPDGVGIKIRSIALKISGAGHGGAIMTVVQRSTDLPAHHQAGTGGADGNVVVVGSLGLNRDTQGEQCYNYEVLHFIKHLFGATDAGADRIEFYSRLLRYFFILHSFNEALARDFPIEFGQPLDELLGLLAHFRLDDAFQGIVAFVPDGLGHVERAGLVVDGHIAAQPAGLLVDDIQGCIVRYPLEPAFETPQRRVVGPNLPEGLFEGLGAYVLDVERIHLLHHRAQVGAYRIDIRVPEGREGGAVADYRPAHQFVNVLRASCFHNCIQR